MGSITPGAALAALLLIWSAHAAALNIVVTNDDGFETPNIQALYRALMGAGHDVILAAPYSGQSGSSGLVAFLAPIRSTAAASPQGTITPGAPGVGPTTLGPQQYYVDGSPVAALLYGIDVAAMATWGAVPDLVISGPNEGNNLGIVTPHSGTVGAAVTALNRGIPAIALSAASGDPAQAEIVAALAVRLVHAIDGGKEVTLPAGIGLNVNTPMIDAAVKSTAGFRFVLTRIGESANFGLRFYARLGDSPMARRFGVPAETPVPGVSMDAPAIAAGYPEDPSPKSETNALKDGKVITLSPIQGTYAADGRAEEDVGRNLEALLRPPGARPGGSDGDRP